MVIQLLTSLNQDEYEEEEEEQDEEEEEEQDEEEEEEIEVGPCNILSKEDQVELINHVKMIMPHEEDIKKIQIHAFNSIEKDIDAQGYLDLPTPQGDKNIQAKGGIK